MSLRKKSYALKLLLLTMVLALGHQGAVAQKEFDTWYFGNRAGISFTGGTARALSDGVMTSGEGSAAISDAQGNLLFYTNGIYAWNRLHRKLVNGRDMGAFKDSTRTELLPNSASQGVVAVPRPGSSTEYYVFTVDAAENGLRGGLRYSVVDMARQGGLGEVTTKNNPVQVPVGDGRLTEKLLAVRHANQRDIWILVHAWNSNVFLAYLLTPTGLATTPVLSAGGIIHQGGNNPRRDYNCIGYMRASRDGRQLAVAQYNNSLELFDFNYGTGIVSNPRLLGLLNSPNILAGFYGVEFSPNGNLLYATSGSSITQYNLVTGSQIQFSIVVYGGALQLAADNKIYVACYQNFGSTSVGVIDAPDTPGLGCAYRANGVVWTGRGSYLGLPNVMVRPPVPGTVLLNYGLLGTDVCEGETSFFTASVYPAIPDAVFTWNFGDPANPGNTASGPAVQHRYLRVGTYVATMTMHEVSGTTRTYAQTVRILPRSPARLQSNAATDCNSSISNALLTITPAQPPGTTYRWQDGSTASQLRATAPGLYWVEVTPPQQCTVRDTLRLAFVPSPTLTLRPEYVICVEDSLVLDPGPQPAGTTYRWQDGSTAPRLAARASGRYVVTVTNARGCGTTAETRVRYGDDCPFKIPNIITPNNDSDNDTFVLQGLEFKGWNLQVFNRWGGLVYQQAHYDNQWGAAGQAAGVYYFLLVNATSGRQLKGWVEVVK
ncbi:T9SS type B sorting domain-containing protein [Hymenobacter daeguensis]